MVAIVTGNGLGLQSSSALGLGARGQFGEASVGQTGEQVYVNAANGNLIVQDRDLMLIGRGVDSRIHRAYNSQGKLTADGWRPGGTRMVGALSGKLNEAGSTVTRTDWDGSAVVYGYDNQRRLYVATSGPGARATLAYDTGTRQWNWWDGGRLLSDIYDATRGGRLISATDRDGNKVGYTYDGAGLLSRVTTAAGESTYLDYTAGRLAQLRTVWIGENGAQRTSTAVRYGYDAAGRLSTVTVDLTPDDNSIADGKVFTTTYRYDGASERVASIAQSDGAEVAFTYALLGGEYRVTSIAQRTDGSVARVTRLAYDLDTRRTAITDMLGAATVLAYDDAGRLVEIVPPAGGTQRFHYDAAGNVVKVDEAGGGVEYRYDERGNRVWQRDAAGGVVEWRYGENDELLEQITRLGGGESATTTYVYDARRHLRFVVDAERRVTEYRYNGFGQQVSVLTYAGAGYAGAGFGEADLARWVAGLADKSAGTRTDTAYDFRGNVASVTRYGRLLKDGTGDARAGAGEVTQTRYVYDPSGRLLQRFVGAPGKQQVEQFAYDGLGRVLSARRFDGTIALYRYDDARHQTIVTFGNGLTRTSTFNGAGELVAVTESAGDVLLSQVGYIYDATGRLRMETDALGQRTHYLYDPAGRKIAQIDAAGGLTEYVYTPAGQVARTIRYAMPLSAEQLAGLADIGGLDDMAALERVRPAAQASDQSEWRAYDGAGRLACSVTGEGALTAYRYDDAGRLLQTVQYANRVGMRGSDPSSEPLPSASAADRSTRFFYDGAGLLRGQLDAEGYLTEYQYDTAGRRIATIRYATAVTDVDRASMSVADFRPAESRNDIRMQASYDARGLLRTEIDGEGHATVYEYDEFGNVAQRVRTERVDQGVARVPQTVRLTFEAKLERPKLTGAVLTIRVDGKDVGKVEVMSTTARRYALDIANLVPADDHSVEFIFGSFMDDATVQNAMFGERPFAQPGSRPNGRPSGMLEKSQNYLLDGAGTEKSWLAASTKQERTAYRYDAMGHLLERTTSTMLGSSATRYTYDSEGRVTSETTGDRALHYRYDMQGRLIAQLSGEGAAALAALAGKPTAAQVDAVWRTWGEHYTYDAAGRRTSSTDANGSRATFYYDAAGRVTHQVNALGEVAERRYDALGNLTQTVAYAKRIGRDAPGELAGGVLTDAVRRAVAALGNERTSRATFAYDHAGRVVRSVDAMAFATWRTYDVFGNEIATRQDLSASMRSTRTTEYDRLGRAVRTAVDPAGLNLVTRAGYDAFGREIETTDANGVVRRREYDRNGNTIVVTDGLGQQSRMTYDAFGNVLTRTDRAGATTRYAYVPDKRQLTVSMPDGIETTTTYDEFGLTVALTDGRGQTTRYAYDRAGRLTGTTTPTGVTRQHYDRAGQLIETVDGRGVRTTYAYDAAGRVLTRTLDPGGLNLTTRYEYDAKGQGVRTTEPSGTVVVTEYDLNGRKVAVVTDAGDGRLNLRTTFEYDGAGKVLATTEGAGTPGARTTCYEYDGASRLTRTVVDPDGLALATCYDYDSNGNVKRVVDAAGGVTRYGYDAENRRICEVGPTGAIVLSHVDAEGRVVVRTAYSIPNAGLLDDMVGPLSPSDLAARITASPGRDRTVRHVYDINGRVRYTLDTLGALTEFRYDENGNAVFAAQHGRVLDATQPLTEASITAQLRRLGFDPFKGASRVTRTVYDAANRAVFVIDPQGYVTQNRLDANGNRVERIQFWRSGWIVMAGFTEPSEKDMLAWAQLEQTFITTRVTSWRYDNAGRVTENIDAEGYLTRNEYDGALLRRTIRYGEVVDGKRSLPVGVIEKLLPAKPAVATTAVTEYRHDGAGRVTDVIDASGVATHYVLDALGRAVETIRAKGTDRQASTRTTFDTAGRMIREVQASGTSAAAAVDYRYDALGNLAVRIDPRGVELAETDSDRALAQRKALGYVDAQGRVLAAAALTAAQREELAVRYATRYRYDAAGRLTDETDPLGHADRTTYDAFGDAVERVTKGVSAKLFYDGLGRVVAQVNPDGAVIQTEYSASGQPIRVARFAKGMLDWGAVAANGDASAILSRLQGQPEAVTHLEYDKLDRLVKSTDAEGGIEVYGYNGFGDRITYQNKVGAVFQYRYDNRGLLISETLPVTSKGRAVQNFHLYDAGGRRTVTIEAAELPEQRTTRFEYDALGRLVRQTGDAVAVRMASGDTRTVEPVETRAYDARGNLVRQTDANGNTTTWYYDAANRKTAEVSATGTLTQWTYDAAGNRIMSRVFAEAVVPTAGAEPPAAVHADRVRETRYRYDENNRPIESRVLNVATGYFDPSAGETQRGEYFITTGSELVTRYRYDGAGRVIEQTDPAGNRTLSFYDRMGNKMLEVDGAGYGIRWERDAEGRVLTETRFAARYPDPIAPNPALADTLAVNWPASADDRITRYTWDGNGRLISETRQGVQHATVDGNGRLEERVADATTRYVYDGEGHLLRKTGANGSQFDFTYDALGRQTSQMLPQFVDYLNRQVRSRISFEYDGLNQVVKETKHGDADQVTTHVFGAGGRLASKTNALGVVTQFGYDAVGNTVLVSFLRADADGRKQLDETGIGYDAANREISRVTRSRDSGNGAVLAGGVLREQRYNAFGEVVGRRTGGGGANGEWQEYADYNNAGWVVRSNFGDGVSRLFLHDRNGNASLKVESMETDLRGHAIETGDDLVGLLKRADMMQTYTRYDARNQVIQVRQPKTSGGAPRVSFSPVDIPIDGGRFANTQLTIGGHSDRPSRPVTGPILPPGGAGQSVGDAGISTGEMRAVPSVSPDNERFTVTLPQSLEADYGPYDIRVDVTYHERSALDDRVVTSGRVPGSPTAIHVDMPPLLGETQQGQWTQLTIHYQIYLFPVNGASPIALLGGGKAPMFPDLYGPDYSFFEHWGTFVRPRGRPDVEYNNELHVRENSLTVANYGVSPATESMLYVRPKGQNVAFRAIERSPSSAPDAYSIDLAGLPDGDYEMIYMAVSNGSDGRPAGTLLRREGYVAHISRAGGSSIVYDAVPPDAPTKRAGLGVDGGGNYVWTSPQQLNMVALRSSAGQLADYVAVRVRGSGERNWREPVLLRRNATSGAFQLDLSGYAPGDYQVQIDLHGQQGMLDSMRGSIALRGAGSAPEMSIAYIGSYSSTIVFRAQPTETDHLMVSWEQDGHTRYSKISRLGNGEFTWDATADGLIPDSGLIYSYSIKFTAYDANGRPLSMGKGDITVGHEGFTEVTLEGSDLPCIFEFSPQDDHGRKLENARTLVLYYRPAPHTQADYDKPFSEAILTRDGAGRFLFDATSLPTNTEYEYRYIAKDAQGNVLTERQSYFLTGTRNNPITNVDIVGVIDETAKDMTIDRMQSHNAFSEVSAERDGRGNWTYSSFNTMGRLTLKREPEIGITLADGTKVRVAPETRFHYDLTGNLVGMKDANGNLSTHQWNYGLAQPAVARSWDALGHDKRFAYDAQGNLRVQYDELNRRTDFTYDAGDRLIRFDRPVLANGANAGRRNVDRYEYDGAGNRIAHIDALGGRERTYYDSEGRVIRTVSAAGRSMQYDYRWASTIGTVGGDVSGGWVKTTTDANGRTMIDESDLFGRLMKHTDLGGRVFDYTYNRAGLLTRQRGTSGQDVSYEYYSHGLVRAIRDRGTQTESLYEYDGDGNRTAEFFRSIGARYLFAQSTVEYDAANRVTAIKDDAYQVRYEYDAVGNRRRMTADYTDLVGYHKRTQDYWYEYDALNRFTVTMGVLSDGRIVAGPKGGDGVQLGYNAAGERVLAVYASDGRTERYEYDANGYLTNQSINGVVVRERESDLLGRVTGYTEYTADRSKRTEQVTRYYDADGLQLSERDVLEGATTRYTRMSDGTLERTERRLDKGDGTTVTTTYTYDWWDGAKQKTAVSQGTNPNAPGWKPASSHYNYDVNGNLKSVYDDGGGQKGKARAFSYWTDLRGQVQRRDELVGVSIAPDGAITGAQGDRKHNYYYLNGHRVGNVGNDGVEKVDYVQELAGKLGKGKESQYRVTTPVSVADFDENYLRIDGTYPGASPGTWTVREGETLKSIASALWGDEALWYVLADANGLKSTDELKAGQTLTVPNKVTNVHNTASTFKPYDPGQAIGDTQPTLPDPPPPPSRGGGCGGFLPVIAIVVAVVATVFTAGALAAPAGASLGTIMTTGASALTGGMGMAGMGAAAVGGAVGAAAGQGVMIAGGAQSGLDWKGIALGAVGASVTAGTGSAWSTLGIANPTVSAVMQGAARSVATQGVGVATGLQHSFDWKGVAASAIASGVGHQAGALTQRAGMQLGVEMGSPGGQFAARVAAGVAAGSASTVVRGGSLGRNVGAITMDAIASTVGNMVVDQIASTPATRTTTLYGASGNVDQIVADATLYQSMAPNQFSMPVASYSSEAALFGNSSLTSLDGMTTTAALSGYAASHDQVPYSAASTLYGLPAGFSTPSPLGHADAFAYTANFDLTGSNGSSLGLAGNDTDVLKYVWDAQRRPSTDVRGGFDRFGSSTAGRAQFDLGSSWVADIPKLPVNLTLNTIEGGVNLVGGALPGAPGYVPFLKEAKIPYNSEASSYAEFGVGLLLGRGAASGPSTVTVYRVEGAGNRRLFIDEVTGSVTIPPVLANKGRGDERNLYLNFGDEARAQEFLAQRLQQFPDNTIKSFEVPKYFVRKLQASAVEEAKRSLNPGKPVIADPTKASNQFGLSREQIEQLRNVIVPGTGRRY